jgi:hypothetical protein
MINIEDYIPEGWSRGNAPYRTPDGEWNHTDLFYKGTLVADADTEWKQVKKTGKKFYIYVMKITKYHTTDPRVIQHIDNVLADVELAITDATYALELQREEQAKIYRAARNKEEAEDEAKKQAAVNKLFDGYTLQRETTKEGYIAKMKSLMAFLDMMESRKGRKKRPKVS